MANVPISAVAEYLGHSETRVTQVYAHLTPNALQSYVGVLDGKTLTLGALPGVQALDSRNQGAGTGGVTVEEQAASAARPKLSVVGGEARKRG
jgi:hypothetical protein